jgi:hypothetical protein
LARISLLCPALGKYGAGVEQENRKRGVPETPNRGGMDNRDMDNRDSHRFMS